MRPAQQRLAGRDAHGLEVEERLEVELEALGGQRVAEVELECPAGLRLEVHFGLEEPPAGAAACLGVIERHVGILEQ